MRIPATTVLEGRLRKTLKGETAMIPAEAPARANTLRVGNGDAMRVRQSRTAKKRLETPGTAVPNRKETTTSTQGQVIQMNESDRQSKAEKAMQRFLVRHRVTGETLYCDMADSLAALIESAAPQDVSLSGAALQGAHLVDVNLDIVSLSSADLSHADFTRSSLSRVDFKGANLIGARLIGSNLEAADLMRANLTGADLEGANLYKANLGNAELAGANLRNANLSFCNLKGCKSHGRRPGGREPARNEPA